MKPLIKYRTIKKFSSKYSVTQMCRFFGVSRSGYYTSSVNAAVACPTLACTVLIISELQVSFAADLRIAKMIQHSAPEQDHEAREAKAEELLNLLADCKNEEDVLKKLNGL